MFLPRVSTPFELESPTYGIIQITCQRTLTLQILEVTFIVSGVYKAFYVCNIFIMLSGTLVRDTTWMYTIILCEDTGQ